MDKEVGKNTLKNIKPRAREESVYGRNECLAVPNTAEV